MSIPTYWRGVTNYGTGYDMMARIEALEAENTRLKLALGQIQRRESPDAGRPYETQMTTLKCQACTNNADACTCRSLCYGCMNDFAKCHCGRVKPRFDEHAGYGENNAPLPPMEGKE